MHVNLFIIIVVPVGSVSFSGFVYLAICKIAKYAFGHKNLKLLIDSGVKHAVVSDNYVEF